jgi:hypothetical protein
MRRESSIRGIVDLRGGSIVGAKIEHPITPRKMEG